MSRKAPEDLSAGELERLLIARRAAEREQRLARARAEGRGGVADQRTNPNATGGPPPTPSARNSAGPPGAGRTARLARLIGAVSRHGKTG